MAKRFSDSRQLSTTIEVMVALGGLQPVSALTGSQYSATENWSRAKTFPSRYFLVMWTALRNSGYDAPPELWGQVTPEQRKEALSALAASLKQRMAS